MAVCPLIVLHKARQIEILRWTSEPLAPRFNSATKPPGCVLSERVFASGQNRVMLNRDGTLPVGFIVAVETKRLFGRAPAALAYVATFSNPVDALSAVRQLGGPHEKVKIVAEILRSTVAALGIGQRAVRLL